MIFYVSFVLTMGYLHELLILLAGCILPSLYIFTALIVIVTIICKFVLNAIL